MSSVSDGFPSALSGHVASVHFGVQRTGRREGRGEKNEEANKERGGSTMKPRS